MEILSTDLPEVKILIPKVFEDERGFFTESWNYRDFTENLHIDINFVQDNHSRSRKGVIRGMHYQVPPHAQSKLVRCISGEIFDVAVDIRKESPTYKRWVGVYLSSLNRRQLWIPKGFAHGFIALSEYAEVQYKTDEYWYKDYERSFRWDDPEIGIKWPNCKEFIISKKDKNASFLNK